VKKALVAVAAIALAVAMFAAGALLPLGARESSGATRVSVSVDEASIPAIADLDSQIAQLQEALRADRSDPKTLALLGLAYVRKARGIADPSYLSKAQTAFDRSLREKPEGNFEASLGMGSVALARHDFSGALQWGRSAAALRPFDDDPFGVIADAFVELGRYQEAARTLQDMVDLRPALAAYSRISYLKELRGDVSGAIHAMKAALAASSGTDAAWTAGQLGDLYLSQGELPRARYEYRRALFLSKTALPARVGLARIAQAHGRTRWAIREMERVTRIYPLPQYVALLGELYGSVNNDTAENAQYALVKAQMKLYDANGVIPDVEVYLFTADHGTPSLHAQMQLTALYRLRPSVRVADALAWTLHARGLDGRAARLSSQALRLGTRDALYHFHAGVIADSLGRKTQAKTYLGQALEINPYFSVVHSPVARRTLQSLRSSR
jgi:tetratricopeptide (TPR) repeat protein